MRYVLGPSVALKWVLSEADSSIALRLQAEAHAAHHQLLSTDFYALEIANALTRAERKGIISSGDADPLLLKILRTPPMLYDSMPLLRRAAAFSSTTRQGLYDCLYCVVQTKYWVHLLHQPDA